VAGLGAGHDDGSIRLWDIGSSQCLELMQHAGAVTALCTAPGSKLGPLVLSAGLDGLVCCWALSGPLSSRQPPQLLCRLQAHGATTGTAPAAIAAARAAEANRQLERMAEVLKESAAAAAAADPLLAAEREKARQKAAARHWGRAHAAIATSLALAAPVLQGSFVEDAARRIAEAQALESGVGPPAKSAGASFLLAATASAASLASGNSTLSRRGTLSAAASASRLSYGSALTASSSMSALGTPLGAPGMPLVARPGVARPHSGLLLQAASSTRKQHPSKSVTFSLARQATMPLARPRSPPTTTQAPPAADSCTATPLVPEPTPPTSAPTSAVSSRGPSAASSPLPPSLTPLPTSPAASPEPPAARPDNPEILCMACDPELHLCVTGGSNGSIRLWALGGSERKGSLHGHGDAVTCLCLLAPGGGVLFSGSEDGSIAVWSGLPGAGGGQQGAAGCSRSPSRLGGREEGARSGTPLGLAGGKAGGKGVAKPQHTLQEHTAAVTGLLVLPGGRHLASCSRDGQLVVWEWAAGAVVARQQAGQELLCLALRQGGRDLLAGAASGEMLRFGVAELLSGRAVAVGAS
jgi:WD40 repeat protein